VTSERRKGFTLIELLVVIAIIGILAAMLFPVFARARESARKIQCLSNVKNIALAIQMYLTDYDRFPPDETRSDVINYFYSDGGTKGPGGCGVCNYHQTCETIGRPMDANPYLRAPVILDEYIRNRDVWKCPSAKTEKGACYIVPDYHPGGWLQYMKDTEGMWGAYSPNGRIGPCMLDWPTGWGGVVTDSAVQGGLAEWWGEGSGVFFFSIDANLSKTTATMSLSSMNDPAKFVAVQDAGFHNPLPVTVLRLAYPDVNAMAEACEDPPGGGDWENCSWSRDCSSGTGEYGILWLTDAGYRRKFTRHLGGSNIGFADGHAKWYKAEDIIAHAPKYKCGCWGGGLVYNGLEGIDADGPTHPEAGGPMPDGWCFSYSPIY
jgi:prepilin-type N-terminal cleavage/methylation domain-containing protein/prepilin-type processing-associated H-X9-DG protein